MTIMSVMKSSLQGERRKHQKNVKKNRKKLFYNLDVSVNYDIYGDDGNLKRSYLNKYVNRNYKNKNTTVPGDPDKIYDDDIGPTEQQVEEIVKKENTDRKKLNKNLPTEALLRQFNNMYSCKLKLDDMQIKLFEKIY